MQPQEKPTSARLPVERVSGCVHAWSVSLKNPSREANKGLTRASCRFTHFSATVAKLNTPAQPVDIRRKVQQSVGEESNAECLPATNGCLSPTMLFAIRM